MSRLWIDVEDLFAHAGAFQRPSGIQRVTIELCHALAGNPQVGFLRHAGREGFSVVSWQAIEASLADEAAREVPADPTGFWSAQSGALRTLAKLPLTLLPPGRHGPPAPLARGDVILVAGAGWNDVTSAARILAAKRRLDLRVAVLLHDLIPLRRPEWCDRQTVHRFTRWCDALLGGADVLLANSAATARDVAARLVALRLPEMPVTVIRFGDGFTMPGPAALAMTERHVVFVSTLERRKNHALLVEVWRVLLHRQGPDAVPRLVFAGREGPLSGDLLSLLRASRFLDGHIVWHPAPSDLELAALYAGCDFTLFPSLYEGWGLPVAESLCFGAPCLAARATSVPEVGGDLVRYFDPMDLGDAVRVIGDVVARPEQLPEWRLQIKDRFRPTSWSATAGILLDVVRRRSVLEL